MERNQAVYLAGVIISNILVNESIMPCFVYANDIKQYLTFNVFVNEYMSPIYTTTLKLEIQMNGLSLTQEINCISVFQE